MKRGGTFPRWRWRRRHSPHFALEHESSFGVAWVTDYRLPVATSLPWWAEVHAGTVDGYTVRSERFSRRCDAKRWCERQLANEYARSWGNDPDARVPAVYGEIVFATGEHP